MASTARVEQVELEQPRQAVRAAGAVTELLSIKPGEIQAVNHDIHPSVGLADFCALAR